MDKPDIWPKVQYLQEKSWLTALTRTKQSPKWSTPLVIHTPTSWSKTPTECWLCLVLVDLSSWCEWHRLMWLSVEVFSTVLACRCGVWVSVRKRIIRCVSQIMSFLVKFEFCYFVFVFCCCYKYNYSALIIKQELLQFQVQKCKNHTCMIRFSDYKVYYIFSVQQTLRTW